MGRPCRRRAGSENRRRTDIAAAREAIDVSGPRSCRRCEAYRGPKVGQARTMEGPERGHTRPRRLATGSVRSRDAVKPSDRGSGSGRAETDPALSPDTQSTDAVRARSPYPRGRPTVLMGAGPGLRAGRRSGGRGLARGRASPAQGPCLNPIGMRRGRLEGMAQSTTRPRGHGQGRAELGGPGPERPRVEPDAVGRREAREGAALRGRRVADRVRVRGSACRGS